MKKLTKVGIVILVFLLMVLVSQSYMTNQAKWVGIRRTGETGDAVIPVNEAANDSLNVNITESVALNIITNTPLQVNISNYGMKEYTFMIVNNGTNLSSVTFSGLLNHLIIQPNSSTVDWKFKLTDDDDYIIYDGSMSLVGQLYFPSSPKIQPPLQALYLPVS